jgi:hypothetical protein
MLPPITVASGGAIEASYGQEIEDGDHRAQVPEHGDQGIHWA